MSLTSSGFSTPSSIADGSRHSSSASGRGGPTDTSILNQTFREFRLRGNDEFLGFPRFSESEIRNALKAEAEKHPTWKTAAVKHMKIVNIETAVVFKYTLETFTEARSTYEVTEPYKGTSLPSDMGANMVSVWDVACKPNQMFAEETQIQEMPGSCFLQKCETCKGQAESTCFRCRGVGTTRCNACNGTGMRTGVPHPLVGPGAMKTSSSSGHKKVPGIGTPMTFESAISLGAAGVTTMDLCQQCKGHGVKECGQCKGQGKSVCATCNGYGQHKVYTALKVRYELDKAVHFHEPSLADEILNRVRGETILVETGENVTAANNIPLEAIKETSRKLIQSHTNKHAGSNRIVQQRQMLEAIPLAEVTYDFNGHKGRCWVVGLERMAYIPQYPKKCSIL